MGGLFVFSQLFKDSKTKTFKAPFDSSSDALAFGTAVLDSQFEVLEPKSTSGNKAVASYKKVLITCKKLVDGKVADKGYLAAIVKYNTQENDVQAALVGKTFGDGVTSFQIDEVAMSELKVVSP